MNSGGTVHTILYWYIHPNYDSQSTDFDVSVVRLLSSLNLNGGSIRPARLVDSGTDLPAGEMVTVTGWGRLSVRIFFQVHDLIFILFNNIG